VRTIEFYKTIDDKCPVIEFLDSLFAKQDSQLHTLQIKEVHLNPEKSKLEIKENKAA
jgi:hypothetical protein